METEAGMHKVVWCMSEYKCFCNVLNHVKGPWQRGVLTISSGQLQHALMRNSSLRQPSSYWLDLYTISKITLLNVSGSYIWFTTHNSANCGCDTCRGSPRGSPSGCLSGSRGVRSPSSCAESGPIRCWPDCSASRSQPTQANGVQLFFFQWSRELLGSNIAANRRLRQAGSGHHSTGPWARGKHPPCGFPLLTNIKDLAFAFDQFCYPFLCAIL